jgi:hypothetical protein
VLDHQGPRPEAYHETIYGRLLQATKGLKGQAFKDAVKMTLDELGKECQTAGSMLNWLITF